MPRRASTVPVTGRQEPGDRDRLGVVVADIGEPVEHGQVAQRLRRVAVDDDERPAGVAVPPRAGGDVGAPVLAGAGALHERGDVGELLVRLVAVAVGPKRALRGDRPVGGPRGRRSDIWPIGSVVVVPFVPPVRRAPQYRPANRTLDPAGRITCELDELKVGNAAPSWSRLTMSLSLLFDAAPTWCRLRTFVQAVPAGQVSRLLPKMAMVPLSLGWKAMPNGTIVSATTDGDGDVVTRPSETTSAVHRHARAPLVQRRRAAAADTVGKSRTSRRSDGPVARPRGLN